MKTGGTRQCSKSRKGKRMNRKRENYKQRERFRSAKTEKRGTWRSSNAERRNMRKPL